MKRTLILAGLAAAAFLASCSKTETPDNNTPEAQQTINLDVRVSDFGDGVDTKTVKTGWMSGDKLNIWFDGNFGASPDLIMTFNGTEWTAGGLRSGVALKANGTMSVLYEGYNDLTARSYPTANTIDAINRTLLFPKCTSTKVDGLNEAYATPLWVGADNMEYSYNSGTRMLSSDIDTWTFITEDQVTITGLTGSNWALKCDGLLGKVAVCIDAEGFVLSGNRMYGEYILGVPDSKNALAFFGGGKALDTNIFILYNLDTGKKYSYTVSGKQFNSDDRTLLAVTIPFSKFTELVPSLSLKKTSAVLGINDVLSLKPYLVYNNINPEDITFTSSDSSVASVDEDMNIVTNGKVGSARITIKAGGLSTNFNVKTEDSFLMYVEDIFTITGRGTVVTGTALTGRINKGDYVDIYTPSDEIANHHTVVTGIEISRQEKDSYSYEDGAAGFNIRGVERTDVPRGSLFMTPGSERPIVTKKITLSLYMLTKEEGGRHTPVGPNYRPQLYIGNSDYTISLSDFGGEEMLMPGESYYDIVADVVPGTGLAVFIGQSVVIREGGKSVATAVITDAVPESVTYVEPD